MKCCLLSLGYLPPVSWFQAMVASPTVLLEQHEHYAKGSYRNRCVVASANGPLRLTIPLRKGKNEQQPIRSVKIAYDEPWQIQHWRAIKSAYGSSPFYEHYCHLLQPFYEDDSFEFLWEWNMAMLRLCLRILKIQNELAWTEKYEQTPATCQDLRHLVHPKLDPVLIGIQPFKYPQVFEDRLGFLPNLSILDLIFCAGRMPV